MVEARYLGLTANELAKVASDLDVENAKLRELAREMYEDAIMEYPNHFDKTYLSRFVELGIEVG